MQGQHVSTLITSLVNTPDNFVAGKITQFWTNWTEVTSDQTLLRMIGSGYKLHFESNPCNFCSRSEISFNIHEEQIIDALLEKFLTKKVIEVTNHVVGEVISHIFIRPKSDGSYRLILNLRNLNEHIEYIHFKMETLQSVLRLVRLNCFFAKIDLKDAYYSVPIAEESRKYLRFTWKGVLYQYTSLANGLCSAPRIWTKLMKPVFSTLRKQSHINSIYIDDAFAQLIGKLVASEHGVLYAPIYYKLMEIQKDDELKRAKGNFEAPMTLSLKSKECLRWWVHNVQKSYKPISFGKPDRKIESDSSGVGYGARDVTTGQDISGVWSEGEKLHHINFLELKAAFLGLKGLCSHVVNEHIYLYLDNTTAIKYLSKMGGRKSDLNDLTREIWIWCAERKIVLSIFHVPGICNTHADALSRQKLNQDMEWQLNKQIFLQVMKLFGMCDIDMFASSQNYQLKPYVSYLPDSNAYAINAFSLNWKTFYAFLFPPFSVIAATLQKLEEDAADAILIAPIFATQPWFPRLLHMIIDYPRILPKSESLLSQPHSQKRHPLKQMMLGAFKVSGNSWKAKDFHQRLPELSSILGDLPRANNMGRISRNGCYFVVKNKCLFFIHL